MELKYTGQDGEAGGGGVASRYVAFANNRSGGRRTQFYRAKVQGSDGPSVVRWFYFLFFIFSFFFFLKRLELFFFEF